jgi:hypothetical protein
MRRLLQAGLLALVLAVLLAFMPATASAAVVTNVRVPLNLTVFSPCNGDVIAVTGEIHLLASSTSDGAGGFHVTFMDNVSGVTGVGSISGATYHGVGGDWFSGNARPPFPVVLTQTDVFALISAGSAPNFVVTDTVHITVNADGTLTANVARFSVACR